MSNRRRIYLDNAATSWPKPTTVYEAVEHFMRELGAPAGRSAYHEAAEVQRQVERTRQLTAELLNVREPRRIIFTFNGTDSLNLALHGLLRPGDHVVTSVIEHNSVLRPLRFLEQHRKVKVDRVACDAAGIIDPDAIRKALRSNTRMIALIHASNVTGAIQPAEDIGRIAREHGVLFLLDAAQSLGHLPIDAEQIGAHLIAAPGHKGLLGPLGSGLLYIAPGVEEQLLPLRQGGTGTLSEDDNQPHTLPDKYESGNHNVPAIVGLGAGIEHLKNHTLERIREEEQDLTRQLLEGLRAIVGVTIHGPSEWNRRVGVVSITLQDYSPQEAAALLDSAYSIQTRAGLHCAPLTHQALGTAKRERSQADADQFNGTLRFSVGPFNTQDDINTTVSAIEQLAAS